ncbi:MAG: 3-hydroxyacyl-CoA dehydrogenase NAD-binding domain-containing protein, partial [Thermoanaerobaculia bacterium]|nr:3-hydroxyacyl-CoA dehydrogenase NAD-binding domain-containing protein [Thermoanaerobaculia bacterium]
MWGFGRTCANRTRIEGRGTGSGDRECGTSGVEVASNSTPVFPYSRIPGLSPPFPISGPVALPDPENREPGTDTMPPAQDSKGAGKMSEIRKVGVLGCGLMGSGIAQISAQSGYETVVAE